ncbi:MAG: ATP-binding cassette domain-containing protein [Lachnospiraceae bacterium]|nr:ATP-binding cassette domain-containing protein [Lachnospiraceae bacterium]
MEAGMRWDFWKDGCGKTMLMRAVAGLIYPTSGSVIIDGEVLGKDRSFPKSMGLLILDATLIHHPLILNKNQYKGAFL